MSYTVSNVSQSSSYTSSDVSQSTTYSTTNIGTSLSYATTVLDQASNFLQFENWFWTTNNDLWNKIDTVWRMS